MRRRGVALGALVVALTAFVAGAAQAERGVFENIEASVSGRVEPFRLPRNGQAPISVFIAGHLSTTNGTTPPQLQRMTIQLNRHGSLDSTGLPVCRLAQIQPASTEDALARLRQLADRRRPVLGRDRPSRPGPLPHRRAPARLQRPRRLPSRRLRPHLHRQPLL